MSHPAVLECQILLSKRELIFVFKCHVKLDLMTTGLSLIKVATIAIFNYIKYHFFKMPYNFMTTSSIVTDLLNVFISVEALT